MFTALKGTHFYIIFVATAASVILWGGPKTFFSFDPMRSAEIFLEIRKIQCLGKSTLFYFGTP